MSWTSAAAAFSCWCCWELWSRDVAPGRVEEGASACSSIIISCFLIKVQNCFARIFCCWIVPYIWLISALFMFVFTFKLLQFRVCSWESSGMFLLSHLRGHWTQLLYIFLKLHFIPLTHCDLRAVSIHASFGVKRLDFRYGWISRLSYWMCLTLLWDFSNSFNCVKATLFAAIFSYFLLIDSSDMGFLTFLNLFVQVSQSHLELDVPSELKNTFLISSSSLLLRICLR